ncbi:rod shape-determining protein MreC [Hydrogenophaga sp.]|uniref:rod shape-determining protein MreC n=1 Tax=Hydrogenophaga sp. TaxID=1904254 RepID=UPI002718331A|nr:rod shape-determining protein MreC [Hydrogenophaga sp.]MDO8905059.1 rod shape-determining protein MreC [Hydrogenophaga sp.]
MPLGTLDRTPPPFFKQGPSALSKLLVFSAMALFLMVADVRFQVTGPVRSAMATVLYPVQWLVMQPIQAASTAGGYLTTLHEARRTEREALERLSAQAARSLQVEQLLQENQHLREMLTMRERSQSVATGAQVLYDTADPYSRKVVIDRGQAHGVVAGSPVIDEHGVLGQITRVYPLLSEVTLLIDRDQAIPVVNARTSLRGVAFGQPSASGDALELRYTLASADIEEGDLLTTSGVDGVYPPGLPVARVTRIERRSESAFNRVECEPVARVLGALHVLVLTPVGLTQPPPPEQEPTGVRPRQGGRGDLPGRRGAAP